MSIQFTPAEAAEQVASVLKKAIDNGQLTDIETLDVNGRNMYDHFRLKARCVDCQKALTFRDEIDGELIYDTSEQFTTGNKTPYCSECYDRRFGDSSNG